jgi:hypothetical protein
VELECFVIEICWINRLRCSDRVSGKFESRYNFDTYSVSEYNDNVSKVQYVWGWIFHILHPISGSLHDH